MSVYRRYRWLPLLLALLVGLALRLALWDNLPRLGFISDEAEYLAAAAWLAQGRGFLWHQGWLWTRAPVYPLFLAAHIRLFGMNLAPIYATQTVLSLVNVVLVSVLAQNHPCSENESAGERRAPFVAALLAALSLPFATHPQMLLSETLFITLLLVVFVLLRRYALHPSPGGGALLLRLAPAGVLSGMATLTRGLTLGFLPLIAVWIWWVGRRGGAAPRRAALIYLAACALTILPWSVYASRLYGGVILVDTTSAYNLLLGARAAYDDTGSSPRARDFVLALLNPRLSPAERRDLLADSCLLRQNDPRILAALEQPVTTITQGQRQQLMTAEATCLMLAKPGAVVAKSLGETVAFFQINYTGAERMSSGFAVGRLPRWYALTLFLLDDTLYVLMLPLAVVGWARQSARRDERGAPFHTLVGLWWLYIILTTPLLFAINRFRLPFMPFVCIYAAALLRPVPAALPHPSRLARVLPLVLALLLATVAITPYAYLQSPPSSWASYLGPYPSSLEATRIAWKSRPTGVQVQHLIEALGRGDAAQARSLIEGGGIPSDTLRLALPLLAGLEGHPEAGLALLPDQATLDATKDWQASVVRGDLLRRMGNESAAKAAFTPTYVDDQNPVAWAWKWLHPAPTSRIDLAGNLDPGYIRGFYLGEGDPSAGGTFRWSGPEALLRFPQQGTGMPQQVCLRSDGRGWPNDMPRPHVSLLHYPGGLDQPAQQVATFVVPADVRVVCQQVPPTPAGADVMLALHSETFVPDAADLLAQQGPQTGQLRLPGIRLDWVELR